MLPAKTIELTRGLSALVDDCDHAALDKYKWYASPRPDGKYVATRHNPARAEGGAALLLMHRVIICPEDGVDVDHENGDTLDNRRHNIRPATRSENLCNKGKKPNCSSMYIGVSWFKPVSMWFAYATKDGKRTSIGYFRNEEDAARARDRIVIELHGAFARLNFPVAA